jgi:hypothetical protein
MRGHILLWVLVAQNTKADESRRAFGKKNWAHAGKAGTCVLVSGQREGTSYKHLMGIYHHTPGVVINEYPLYTLQPGLSGAIDSWLFFGKAKTKHEGRWWITTGS